MKPLSILQAQLTDIGRNIIEVIPQAIVAIVVLVVTLIAARIAQKIIERLLRRTHMRPSLKSLFRLLTGIGLWTIGLMLAALVAFPNLTPTKLLTGLGIGSVAIGFAFKDIFENFLAGIIILLRREMRIGDFVECEGISGKVEQISIRETHIRQPDDQLIIVPNSILFKNPLQIMTDKGKRRITIICGVGYGEDVDQARTIILDAVRGCDLVSSDHDVEVYACEFADSSINYEVSWWSGSTPLAERQSRDQVVAAIKRTLDEEEVEIPFPYRTLTFSQPLEVLSTHKEEG